MTITHDDVDPFANYDEDKADERMNIIGQNGNTGESYEKKSGCTTCICGKSLKKENK